MNTNQYMEQEIKKACKKIAPAWPLKNFVAVNPYLGLTDVPFHKAAKELSERAGINMTMPIQFYIDEFDNEKFTNSDLEKALKVYNKIYLTPNQFIDKAKNLSVHSELQNEIKVKTMLDACEELNGKNWTDFMIDKVSSWASSYFDEIQTLWNTTNGSIELFSSWKSDAEIDLSTELMGVKQFRMHLKNIPNNFDEAFSFIISELCINEKQLEPYLHTLLLKIVGWSSFIAGNDWEDNLYGEKSENLRSFLAILLCWEYCLAKSFETKGILSIWESNKQNASYNSEKFDELLETKLILQQAYDFSHENELRQKFEANHVNTGNKKRAKAQAVFCIDVRSEVYRRNLERIDSDFETIGFAGFFGFAINYVPMGHKKGKNQCPVLIPSGAVVKESLANPEEVEKATKSRLIKHQVAKTWKMFKSGAVSSFGFVSPLGLSFLPKLVSDSLGWSRPVENPDNDGLEKWLSEGRELDLSEITLSEKIAMAEGALIAMGLKNNMAPFVLITGHGSSSINNPHATGLDCGACGGHSGEINAMTAEKILNDQQVRNGLQVKGIEIPKDTHFVACLHDTTTDVIHVVGEKNIPQELKEAFSEVKKSLIKGSEGARNERALRLNISESDVHNSILKRSNDWAQVRPEWGLAGCSAFVVAPRNRTKGIDLGGKSFLQSYDWKTDEGFAVLESIITAPMVVTSWINLQYYASTTDNKRFGAGNKTLHNVTGGIGVLEGSAGDLRIGLPMQSIHNGEVYQHLPQRLNVVIEAPIEAINDILKKHASVKDLCDNSWISLLLLDENGKVSKKYTHDLKWESIEANYTASQQTSMQTA